MSVQRPVGWALESLILQVSTSVLQKETSEQKGSRLGQCGPRLVPEIIYIFFLNKIFEYDALHERIGPNPRQRLFSVSSYYFLKDRHSLSLATVHEVPSIVTQYSNVLCT